MSTRPQPSPGTSNPARVDPRLGTWLRALRQSLHPIDLGLAPQPRRRSSCLTQVDLARLAGMTPRAYQGVEQGHRNPGPRLLAGVARALHLTATQRAHLLRLAGLRPATSPVPLDPGSLQDLVGGYPTPSVAYDQTWTVLASNHQFEAALPDLATMPEPNLLLWFFTSPAAKRLFVDWPAEAADLIARLRTVQAHYTDTTAFDSLVSKLRAASRHARNLWDEGVAVAPEPARRTHRVRGHDDHIWYVTMVQLQPAGSGDPSVRVAVYLPQTRRRHVANSDVLHVHRSSTAQSSARTG